MKVSVIVPVFNAEMFIKKCLDALLNQDFDKADYEIIVVDNGSTDRTVQILKGYDRIILLSETETQSSYAARNLGLSVAKGDIIAFTDADCIPHKSWISEGIIFLEAHDVSLVGGRVEFYYSPKMTASELLDSFTDLNNRFFVEQLNAAITANLFVKREVFNTIGIFDSSLKSGGDYQFTKNATDKGFALGYCDSCFVYHPTRTFLEICKKKYRTNTAAIKVRKNMGHGRSFFRDCLGLIRSLFRFVHPFKWKSRVRELDLNISAVNVMRISFVQY